MAGAGQPGRKVALKEPQRAQVRRWFADDRCTVTEAEERAKKLGWKVSRGTIASLRREALGTGGGPLAPIDEPDPAISLGARAQRKAQAVEKELNALREQIADCQRRLGEVERSRTAPVEPHIVVTAEEAHAQALSALSAQLRSPGLDPKERAELTKALMSMVKDRPRGEGGGAQDWEPYQDSL